MTPEGFADGADRIFEEQDEMKVPHLYEVHDVDLPEPVLRLEYSEVHEDFAEVEQVIVWWQEQMQEELEERLREVGKMDTEDLAKLSEF